MAQSAETAAVSVADVGPTGELGGFSLLCGVSGPAVGIFVCLFLRETAPRRVAGR